MAAWRGKALESFPEMRREIEDPEETHSVMDLWFELLPKCRDAHRPPQDEDLLRRIYSYAGWCFDQPSFEVRNAVAVGFYEHLWDDLTLADQIAPWVNERVARECWALWEDRLKPEELRRVSELTRRR